MIGQIERFVETVNEKTHISGLFKSSRPFFLHIAGIPIEIVGGNARLSPGSADARDSECSGTASITGEAEAIVQLLKGEKRLRDLLNQEAVEISASFRTILKLESVFLLAKK
ncbi:hypothetical protein D1B31_03510 [Neobacillus notoginsengisoli]|uniref:SCP2 domain-containing protein n=1 Tax=Neobacillus notoginsengisoli TaxID=1578198 RepID=A0A417YYR3_9BACI|nr:hypothetical protein [Neobacillus notoginsengisoli]RHW42670.1 hypothetical protein D1B31_03510 [Neobacillus notoginsengisoli]